MKHKIKFTKRFNEVQRRRVENLRKLLAKNGTATELAAKLGYDSTSFISQMVGPNPHKRVSERTARHIEEKLKLAHGWLDRA